MPTPFLSSEEYDERAHRLYDQGEYDTAIETLKEGLRLYPHSVELYVGLGYTRLARDEFAWARQSFERALVLDPEHEDALVGMGETVLRFGRREEALSLFQRARATGNAEDSDLLMSMGRALYREGLYGEARQVFDAAAVANPVNADPLAALGYTVHRLGDEAAAEQRLRQALQLDPNHHEARVYLGHLLYDRGDWAGALEEFLQVSPEDHWDTLALWRLVELKRALGGDGVQDLVAWEARLESLETTADPLDELLAALEAGEPEDAVEEGEQVGFAISADGTHRVQLPEGEVCNGNWLEIVCQLRDARGLPGETVAQFMRRRAEDLRARTGHAVSAEDPQEFVVACAREGFWQIEF